VNGMWRAFAEANGSDPGKVSEGANYLRVCESATGLNAEEASAFAEGIREVLSGRRANFEMEYPCHSPTERRWFIGRVTPYFCNEKSWAVVAHENITERKLAEVALRDQKVLLETILGQAADAIIVCDDRAGSRSPTPRRGAWRCRIPKAPPWTHTRRCGGWRTTPTAASYLGRNGLYPEPCEGRRRSAGRCA
jgi:PAS domain-containing protein